MDALNFLKADHDRTRDLLQRMAATTAEQVDLRNQLLRLLQQELDIHARIEEDLFYPAMDRLDHTGIEQSRREHRRMREMLAALDRLDISDPHWLDALRILDRHIERHVQEEETALFARARQQIANQLDGLGDRMFQERSDLLRSY